jgi:hypothetical protein
MEDYELEFARCIMAIIWLILCLIIILQIAIIVKLGEVKREQVRQKELVNILVDCELARKDMQNGL